MNIMSFNLRTSEGDDGKNSWKYRAQGVADFISSSDADIICTQEATPRILTDLCRGITRKLDFFGIGRLLGPEHKIEGELSLLEEPFIYADELVGFDEMNPILINPDKFERLDSGAFWLSENPDVPRTLFVGQHPLLPRICAWSKLRDKETKEEFAVFNTHLDHINEDIRLKQVDIIIDRIKKYKQENNNIDVFLTGDFNTRPVGEVYARLLASELSLKDLTAGISESFHNFGKDGEKDIGHKIDYIFTDIDIHDTDFEAVSFEKSDKGSYLSDHYVLEVRITK